MNIGENNAAASSGKLAVLIQRLMVMLDTLSVRWRAGFTGLSGSTMYQSQSRLGTNFEP
jgi:hypothetical protein